MTCGGISTPGQVVPDGAAQVLARAAESARGPEPWKARKISEAQQLLALADRAGPARMQIIGLDLAEDLRAALRLDAPVAIMSAPGAALRIERGAVIGLVYPMAILAQPLPGTALVSLLHPHRAWYPNVAYVPGQPLCLGTSIPARIPVAELVVLAWGLLTMQNVMLDAGDPAGVLNGAAAEWWQANRALMPLTREPLLPRRGREGAAC
jgi:hypothetical protein